MDTTKETDDLTHEHSPSHDTKINEDKTFIQSIENGDDFSMTDEERKQAEHNEELAQNLKSNQEGERILQIMNHPSMKT